MTRLHEEPPAGTDAIGRVLIARRALRDHGTATRGFVSPSRRDAWICGALVIDERSMKVLRSKGNAVKAFLGGVAESVRWRDVPAEESRIAGERTLTP